MDLLLLPRLVVRTLDDLHEIAGAAGTAVLTLQRLEARAARIEDRLDVAIEAAQAIEARAGEVLLVVERALELGTAIEGRAEQALAESAAIQEAAREVALRAAEVAGALPLLERAVALAEPLEGAVERMGRIVDRLPGGRAAAARTGGRASSP